MDGTDFLFSQHLDGDIMCWDLSKNHTLGQGDMPLISVRTSVRGLVPSKEYKNIFWGCTLLLSSRRSALVFR